MVFADKYAETFNFPWTPLFCQTACCMKSFFVSCFVVRLLMCCWGFWEQALWQGWLCARGLLVDFWSFFDGTRDCFAIVCLANVPACLIVRHCWSWSVCVFGEYCCWGKELEILDYEFWILVWEYWLVCEEFWFWGLGIGDFGLWILDCGWGIVFGGICFLFGGLCILIVFKKVAFWCFIIVLWW